MPEEVMITEEEIENLMDEFSQAGSVAFLHAQRSYSDVCFYVTKAILKAERKKWAEEEADELQRMIDTNSVWFSHDGCLTLVDYIAVKRLKSVTVQKEMR
jgi:hypothetical protein